MKQLMVLVLLSASISSFASDFNECIKERLSSIDLSKVEDKMNLRAKEASFNVLANPERPNSAEKQQIAAFANAREVCYRQSDLHTNKEYDKQAVDMVFKGFHDLQAAIAKLYSGNISYGEFIQMEVEISNRTEAGLSVRNTEIQKLQKKIAEMDAADNEKQAVRQQQQAEMQVEAERQRRVQANAILLQGIGNAFRNAAPRSPVNCTSNTYGGVVSTNCY